MISSACDAIENMPISYIPLGGPQDCIVLHKGEGYPLPFLVEGYYDLRFVYDENGRFLGARDPEQNIITPEQAALEAERRIREREADPEAKASHEWFKQILRDIAKAHPPKEEGS